MGALSEELVQAALRKRRVQQWVCMFGRPECESQLRQLKAAIAEDSDPMWAALAAFDPAVAEGTDDEKMAVFRRVRDEIKAKFTAYGVTVKSGKLS